MEQEPSILDRAFSNPELEFPYTPIMDALMASLIPQPSTYSSGETEQVQAQLRRKLFGNDLHKEYRGHMDMVGE